MDILTHFEICELGPSGEYIPVPVTHPEGQDSYFMLQQGLQRRIRMTLVYEMVGSEIHWTKVNEIVIGMVQRWLASIIPEFFII